jgi:pSer/pThr/pTyr-binding forkhead associated (FHA) protein
VVSGLYYPKLKKCFDFDDIQSEGGGLKETIYIGRHPKSDIVLKPSTVSAWHCKIIRDCDGTCTLVDTKSRHGVRVNDIAVTSTQIFPGMWIALGKQVELIVISVDHKMPILAGSVDSFYVNSARDHGSARRAAKFIGRSHATISRMLKRIRKKKK